jgi:hypothetical protein
MEPAHCCGSSDEVLEGVDEGEAPVRRIALPRVVARASHQSQQKRSSAYISFSQAPSNVEVALPTY